MAGHVCRYPFGVRLCLPERKKAASRASKTGCDGALSRRPTHEHSIRAAISLAGVVDLKKAFALHLSNDAVVEFLGGRPEEVPDHYREADPMELKIAHSRQWLLHGVEDDTVPVAFSRDYASLKKTRGERVNLIEIDHAGHFDVIDPASDGFKKVVAAVQQALS